MASLARADGRAGEVVVTVIAGEGKETKSKPALPGDWGDTYRVAAASFRCTYEVVK